MDYRANYSARVSKQGRQQKIKSSRDIDTDVKREIKQAVHGVSQKDISVHQNSKYKEESYGKINNVINQAQGIFTWITEKKGTEYNI